MKKDLLPVVQAPSSTLAKLITSVVNLHSYQTHADAALSSLLRDRPDLTELLQKVERCNAELVARSASVARTAPAIRLTHGTKASTRNLIDAAFSTGLSLIEAEQAKAYYRKLVRVHHPDKGGRAENFYAVQQAYQAANFPLLLLYHLTAANEVPDEEALAKAYVEVLHKTDFYWSQPSFTVLKLKSSGREDLAVDALRKALISQHAHMTARLHGYVPLEI